MPPMPKLMEQSKLYPPESPEGTRTLVSFLLLGERDNGRAVLRRALAQSERTAIENRGKELTPWILPGKRTEKAAAIVAMLMGFGGGNSSDENAREIATQYVKVCDDIPAWAVARACMRFSSGQVTAEELGESSINLAFRPSTAHVHRLAAKIILPVLEERQNLWDCLHGIERNKILQGPERDRVAAGFEALKKQLHSVTDLEEGAEERRQASLRKFAARDLERLLNEYRQQGLPVPTEQWPTTLGSRLAAGWTIEEINGERVLVAPRRP